MKGIVLAGGSGTRLMPLTKVTSKQLLPVYDKPMIYYPVNTLLRAGITDILIITSPHHAGDFLKYLGSGKEFGAKFTYEIQDKPEGIAQALIIADGFIENEPCALILGDNIFTDDFREEIAAFKSGALIFAKKVDDPERFGVIGFDKNGKVLSLEEKPKKPKSNYAQTGLYVYDKHVLEIVRTLKPSARGEYEISDLNNVYLERGQLHAKVLEGEWIDAGTFESLYHATKIAREYRLGKAGKNPLDGEV